MAAWSTSNGTNHPPVYVDDITITSGVFANSRPVSPPYTVQFNNNRFTNTTVLKLGGPIGAVTVDPRDSNTIVFTTDAGSGGAIYQAKKVGTGNWSADPTPIVGNLPNPSGLAIEPADGTLWWTHDYGQRVVMPYPTPLTGVNRDVLWLMEHATRVIP
jgi:glucose/arabinose dehydrogenase